MNRIIRVLIKEALLEAFADDVLGDLERQNQEETIGHRGKDFAGELVRAIPELAHYQLIDYFPINSEKEKWAFDAEALGHMNTVTIKRIARDGEELWQFLFGQAEHSMERMTSDVSYKTPLLPCDAMVEKVNSDWQKWG
mgnify:FL=1